jgi:S1-C subfamily serine protease
MTIAFFSTNVPLYISISLLLAAALLVEYPMHQTIVATPQPSQLPPSLPPPHPQSSQQQTPHSNTFFHTPTSTIITTATSNTFNGTTLFNLQSHLINSVFNKVQNSIVQVTSKIPSSAPPSSSIPDVSALNPTSTNNPNEGQNATALGSGFVYDTKGHIITNYHVVSNAKTVDVAFMDGNKYTASIVGNDSLGDLAVLKIDEKLNKPIVPLSIVNSSSLRVGDQVIAIGNPYGLDNTMTTGIVSQTGRLIQEPSGISITDAIQTDASINPGNSGGPLLNTKGEVIGINTAGESDRVAFALSSNTVLREVPVLIQRGTFTHSYIGMNGTTLTSDLTEQFSNMPKTFRGVYVNTIVKNGPSDEAGLRGVTTDYYGQKHGGDVITAVNNQNIKEIDQLVTYINQHIRPGDAISLTVYRNGQNIDLKVNTIARSLSSTSPQ